MDGETFLTEVVGEMDTELARLGSRKLLLALTNADLEADAVLRVAAASELAAAGTFEAWADDEDDERAREVFAEVADEERDHYERVLEHAEDVDDVSADGGPVHEYLRGLDETVERIAAGMVGRGLVSARLHAQVVGFFVNEASISMPDVFRELKHETEAMRDRGADLLADLCESEGDWTRAREAAERVIALAYDDYADALAGMGVDPKPVC